MDIERIFDENTINRLFPDIAGKDGAGTVGTDLLADIEKVSDLISVPDFSKTVYVVSEKKNFRSESIYTALADEYTTRNICTSDNGFIEFGNPLCFVMDITGASVDKLLKKTTNHVQEHARKCSVPLFLIGDADDLSRTNQIFNDNDIDLVRFERPISLKEVVEEIGSYLTAAAVKDRKKHILVVDDSTTFLQLVQKTLGRKFKVTVAESAFQGIVEISKLPSDKNFDLILLDYLMPICSGLVLAAMIRQELPESVICFYTSNECTDDIIKTMPFVDSYVLKSTPIMRISDTLEELINKKEKERKYKRAKAQKGRMNNV